MNLTMSFHMMLLIFSPSTVSYTHSLQQETAVDDSCT